MKKKLFLLSGVFALFIGTFGYSQSVSVFAETDDFTDYLLVNDSDKILPPHQMMVPFANGQPQFRILEQNFRQVPIQSDKSDFAASFIFSDSVATIQVFEQGLYKGMPKAPILIHKARYNEDVVTITSRLKFRVYKPTGKKLGLKKTSKILNSPLSTGSWFKIPFRESNIYQINAQYLEELGINVSEIDPRQIQIWGTNSYPLPELSGSDRPDFEQIPIIVQGESDGSFDTNDRILFYGNSPHQVKRNQEFFFHELHPYSNENFVFLTIGSENGERLTVSNEGLQPGENVSTFTDFIWKDEELVKPEDKFKSGRFWLGQQITAPQSGNTVSIFRDTLFGVSSPLNLRINAQLYARSEATTTIDVNINGLDVRSGNVSRLPRGYNDSEGDAALPFNINNTLSVPVSDGVIDLTARITHRDPNSVSFVNYIRLTLERTLTAENNRLLFYTDNNLEEAEIVSFQLKGFSNAPIIMDVTDPSAPLLLEGSNNGSDFLVNYFQNNGKTIIAQSDYPLPLPGNSVQNQNLKGITTYPNYIILTSEELITAANELGQYRQNQGFETQIAIQNQILNEFSGGVKDPTALRDYLKFLYDRAITDGEQLPEYVLLFGDTSYDTKDIIPNALTNHILTYESEESINRIDTYSTDDFFGYLDDNEGDFGNGTTSNSFLMDLGVGRITAQTQSDAATFVDKIKRYEAQSNSGDWQNLFTFAADDNSPDVSDRDTHVKNADVSAEMMDLNQPGIRLKKIYTFSYPVEITGAGRQIPGATQDFIQSVNEGTLVLNYSGHGNEQTLSDEELFLSEYITNFTNTDKLCVLITATCQFGRYDDTSTQSGAERFVSASNGGAIAAFTTTRVVFTSSTLSTTNNFGLNVALSQRMSERKPSGTPKRLGELMRETKNSVINGGSIRVGSSTNNKKFVLLGDPATAFKLPSKNATVTEINGVDLINQDTTLTLRALDQVNLSGRIEDASGNLDNSFNGEAVISVFDGRRSVSLPEREWTCNLNGDCSYLVESDILFKGKVSVQNGEFNQTFIIPKDIGTTELNGRIVLYANESSEGYAGGSFTDITFDGENPNAENDGTGPEMNIYLNDEKFVNGNLVSDSPTLIVELRDNSGINTTGTGVGHEIIATIDTKPEQTFILNEFYEGNLNDFTGGRIEYPLDQLPEGSYSLKVRAWDVQNNPNEKEIFFEVAPQSGLSVRNVYNYPNPMNNRTQFTFEHNQPGNPLDVSVKIYTLSGKPVQQIQQNSIITTNSYANISWNGRDRDNDRLGNGTYIYVLRVTTETPEGKQSHETIEKLVIIR